MREFFRGWKRMVGCLTLMMALAFAGGWVRSHQILDTLTTESVFGSRYYLISSKDGLTWGSRLGYERYTRSPIFMNLGWESTKVASSQFDKDWDQLGIDWHWQCCGFQFAELSLGGRIPTGGQPPSIIRSIRLGGLTMWTIPYWSIVLPLTALSAYLLLTEPRKSIQMKIDEPAENEGA